MLNAGLQPVREEDEVAPLNSYLRWLPRVRPGSRTSASGTQLMFAQHAANLAPVGAAARDGASGHHLLQPRRRADHLRSLESPRPADERAPVPVRPHGLRERAPRSTTSLNQVTAIYRPRLFIVEAGNSFGLFGDFATRLGLTVHRVKLAPGAG